MKKNVAILFGSKHGQTGKIANYMKDRLIAEGHEVNCQNVAAKTFSLGPEVELVIAGAPVYAGKFHSALMKWVKKHRAELKRKTTAFFSVSLNAADGNPKSRRDDDRLLNEFIRKSEWTPDYVASLAGALQYRDYNWLIRMVMRRISASAKGPTDTSINHEMTDWSVVDAFLESIMRDERAGPFATRVRLPVGQDKSPAATAFPSQPLKEI